MTEGRYTHRLYSDPQWPQLEIEDHWESVIWDSLLFFLSTRCEGQRRGSEGDSWRRAVGPGAPHSPAECFEQAFNKN